MREKKIKSMRESTKLIIELKKLINLKLKTNLKQKIFQKILYVVYNK